MKQSEQLKKIKQLLINGEISFAEYSIKKNKILGIEEGPRKIIVPDDNIKEKPNQENTNNKASLEAEKDKSSFQVDSEHISKPKVKNNKMLLILLMLLVFSGTTVGIYILNKNETKPEHSIAEIPKITKYVIASKLNLTELPGEGLESIMELPYRTEVEIEKNKDTTIGEYSYAKAWCKNKFGWITTSKNDTKLINSLEVVESINQIITGNDAQYILNLIPAYSKYALLELSKIEEYKNFIIDVDTLNGFNEIEFFRSGIHNRNSSSDRKKKINNSPKDMAILMSKDDQEIVMILKFNNMYNWSIIYEHNIPTTNCSGFKRMKRRKEISYFNNLGDLIQENLKFDALHVNGSFTDYYLYGENGNISEYFMEYFSDEVEGC